MHGQVSQGHRGQCDEVYRYGRPLVRSSVRSFRVGDMDDPKGQGTASKASDPKL